MQFVSHSTKQTMPVLPAFLSKRPSTFAAALLVYLLTRAGTSVEPVYKVYNRSELGVTFGFPNNILSLDTTARKPACTQPPTT